MQDNVYVYDAIGTMMVFTGAQLEDLIGTITVSFGADTVTVDFAGTHTEGQAAQFNLSGDRP